MSEDAVRCNIPVHSTVLSPLLSPPPQREKKTRRSMYMSTCPTVNCHNGFTPHTVHGGCHSDESKDPFLTRGAALHW